MIVFCKYANKYSHVTFVFDKYQHFGAHKGSIQSKHYVIDIVLDVVFDIVLKVVKFVLKDILKFVLKIMSNPA